MPVFVPAAARVRQELALAIVEGEGAVQGLIGKQILPDFPINRRTAHLIKATLADTLGLRILTDKYIRSPGTEYERAVAKLGDDTMTVTLRGMEIVVPNEVQLDLAGYVAVESLFCGRFAQTSALTQENLIQASIFSTGVFGSATNSLVAYTVVNAATNSFIGDVIASIRRVRAKGEQPNTVVMSGPVYERIRQAATVQAYAAGTLKAGQEATLNTIQGALKEYGIEQVLVGNGYYNNAADGATPSLSQIWSNTYIWVGKAGKTFGTAAKVEGGMDLDIGVGVPTLLGVGANIYWEGFADGGAPGQGGITDKEYAGGNYVETYYEQKIDSVVVRVKLSAQPYIGNSRAGDLVATQYS